MNTADMGVLDAWRRATVIDIESRRYYVLFDSFGWKVTLNWREHGKQDTQVVVINGSSLSEATYEALAQFFNKRERGVR